MLCRTAILFIGLDFASREKAQMKLRLLAICATGVVYFQMAECSAAVIVSYNFNAGTPAPSSVASGVTAGNYTPGTGLGPLTYTGAADKQVDDTAFDGSTLADAKTNSQYYSFTVQPTSGTLTITGLQIDEERFNPAQGAMHFDVFIGTTDVTGDVATNSSLTSHSFSGAAFTGLTGLSGVITVTLYAWLPGNGPDSHHDWANDNVTLLGDVLPRTDPSAPEASSLAIWSVLGLAFSGFNKWNRRRNAANGA
jgi:hypothetical protein